MKLWECYVVLVVWVLLFFEMIRLLECWSMLMMLHVDLGHDLTQIKFNYN